MKQFAYTRELRLLTPKHFQYVFQQPPVKAVNPQFTLLAKPNNLPHPRLGITISKRNVRLAVQRNRIKRRIRETFRLQQHNLVGFDIIVIAKKGVNEQENSQLNKQCDYLWRKLSKRCKQFLLA